MILRNMAPMATLFRSKSESIKPGGALSRSFMNLYCTNRRFLTYTKSKDLLRIGRWQARRDTPSATHK